MKILKLLCGLSIRILPSRDDQMAFLKSLVSDLAGVTPCQSFWLFRLCDENDESSLSFGDARPKSLNTKLS